MTARDAHFSRSRRAADQSSRRDQGAALSAVTLQDRIDEVKRLAALEGHDELLRALDDATYGATSSEVLMATRHHLKEFLAATAPSPALAGLAQHVVAGLDLLLSR